MQSSQPKQFLHRAELFRHSSKRWAKWGRCPHHPRCMLLPHLHWSGMGSGDILLHCRRRFGLRLPWISGCWCFRVQAFGFRIPCSQGPSRGRCFYIHEFDHGRFGELEITGAACQRWLLFAADEFIIARNRRAQHFFLH